MTHWNTQTLHWCYWSYHADVADTSECIFNRVLDVDLISGASVSLHMVLYSVDLWTVHISLLRASHRRLSTQPWFSRAETWWWTQECEECGEKRSRRAWSASSLTPVHTWLLFRRRVSWMIMAAKKKYLKKCFLSDSSKLSVLAPCCQMKTLRVSGGGETAWRTVTVPKSTKGRRPRQPAAPTDKRSSSPNVCSTVSAETQWAAGTQQSLWITGQTHFYSQLTFCTSCGNTEHSI